jgi:hypothetical protein
MVHTNATILKTNSSFLLSIYDSNESIVSCTEKPNFFIEVLDELELFIDKKVIFEAKFFSVGLPSAVCQLIL